jgi:PPOX class probable F420-dependent enzyme
MWNEHRGVQTRLATEPIVWMTTVSAAGKPSTAPVWFYLNHDDSITIYSRDPSVRVRNLEQNPLVTLHLEGDGQGGAIAVLNGTAVIERDAAPATNNEAFIAKYQPFLDRHSWTPQWFAENYPTAIRMTTVSVRG